MKKIIYIIVFLLMVLGGFLRFYKIVQNPVSLNIDEVSIGYNAYSILKTARDENGNFLPLSFVSTGDYKPPILIYLTVPSIAVFGLNEFGVRFPVALISTLSICLYYFLFVKLLKNERVALIGTLFIAVSPWHIYYSRYAVEALVALSFLSLGIFALLKLEEKGSWIWPIMASFAFAISIYTYHPERLFVPLFLSCFFIFKRKIFVRKKLQLGVFFGILLFFLTPLLFSLVFGNDATRAKMIFIRNDIEFTRPVLVKSLEQASFLNFFSRDSFLLLFYWLRKYLNYFTPAFLFYGGLNMTKPNTLGLGVMYLFELPFLLLGLIELVKNKFSNGWLLFCWILFGILPASLVQNEQHSLRVLLILPALVSVSAIGAGVFIRLIRDINSQALRFFACATFLLFALWSVVHAVIVYAIYFPAQKGEAFMEGTKEVVQYALDHKDEYKEIVFDPYRGIEAQYIVSIPHEYILFFSGYDPKQYQEGARRFGDETYGFDKFTIRRINWREFKDKHNYGVLFVGTPWSLPLKDIKGEEVLKKVYLTSGDLAFVIVTPKK